MNRTIVIGGGAGGLSAAIRLASRGRKVLLLEKEPSLGGYLTSFNRAGFTFDVAMHMVAGGAPGGAFYETLRELGVEDRVRMLRFRQGFDTRFGDFHFTAPNSIDAFYEEAVRLFPESADGIFRLKSHQDRYATLFFRLLNGDLGITDTAVRFGPRIPEFLKLASISTSDYFRRFVSDERLFSVLFQPAMFNGVPMERFPAINYLIISYLLLSQGMYIVQGCGGQLSRILEERARELGVEIVLGERVERLCIRNGRAAAVRTSSSANIEADSVICNANPFVIARDLTETEDLTEKYRRRLEGSHPSLSVVQAWFGMREPVENLGIQSVMTGWYPDFNIDPLLSPAGNVVFPEAYSITAPGIEDREGSAKNTNVMSVIGVVHPSAWLNLPKEDYRRQKRECLDRIVRDINTIYPGFADRVTCMTLATPRTFQRYTGNPGGAIMGFDTSLGSRKSILAVSRIPLSNVFFANAWTDKLGGIMQSLKAGIAAAERVIAR
jgi:phytoene dehydrogenase-like protein